MARKEGNYNLHASKLRNASKPSSVKNSTLLKDEGTFLHALRWQYVYVCTYVCVLGVILKECGLTLAGK